MSDLEVVRELTRFLTDRSGYSGTSALEDCVRYHVKTLANTLAKEVVEQNPELAAYLRQQINHLVVQMMSKEEYGALQETLAAAVAKAFRASISGETGD